MKNSGQTELFSDKLEKWLESTGPKTLGGIVDVFQEKSFAIILLLLMSVPALPIPTGGITHIFEIICMAVTLEQVVGLKNPWFPKWLLHRPAGKTLVKKALPFFLRRVRSLERFSKPRLANIMRMRLTNSIVGLVVLGLTFAAFIAPPFSGLDTLPALGVVVISLSIILEDILGALVGILIGAAGVAVIAGLSAAIVSIFN